MISFCGNNHHRFQSYLLILFPFLVYFTNAEAHLAKAANGREGYTTSDLKRDSQIRKETVRLFNTPGFVSLPPGFNYQSMFRMLAETVDKDGNVHPYSEVEEEKKMKDLIKKHKINYKDEHKKNEQQQQEERKAITTTIREEEIESTAKSNKLGDIIDSQSPQYELSNDRNEPININYIKGNLKKDLLAQESSILMKQNLRGSVKQKEATILKVI